MIVRVRIAFDEDTTLSKIELTECRIPDALVKKIKNGAKKLRAINDSLNKMTEWVQPFVCPFKIFDCILQPRKKELVSYEVEGKLDSLECYVDIWEAENLGVIVMALSKSPSARFQLCNYDECSFTLFNEEWDDSEDTKLFLNKLLNNEKFFSYISSPFFSYATTTSTNL